ncbi:MAG: hypothetical protein ABR565_03370 [Gammaproteobacteria bacterium]
METRYIVAAVLIVVGVLALLSYRDADDAHVPVDRPRATDRIVELPGAAEDTPIQTVELDASPIAEQPGTGADATLVRRFEAERVDPAWAPVARARLTALLEPVLDAHRARLDGIECRQTACRLRLEFPDSDSRPVGVGAVMAALADAGRVALLERVQTTRVTILVEA